MKTPDVLYIGYSKTASTYIRQFFDGHPEIYWDRSARQWIFDPPSVSFSELETKRAQASRVYVSMQEKLCESLCFNDEVAWPDIMFTTMRWAELGDKVEINPERVARLARERLPRAHVLMVIRDQVEWLASAYRYYLTNLPGRRRRFGDFCNTLKGTVLLQAAAYDRTIAAYLQSFGPGAVSVLRYEVLERSPDDFLKALCECLGVSPMPFRTEVANRGRSAVSTRLLTHLPALDELPRPLKHLGTRLLAALPGRRRDHALTLAERQILTALFAPGNRRVEQLLAQIAEHKRERRAVDDASTLRDAAPPRTRPEARSLSHD